MQKVKWNCCPDAFKSGLTFGILIGLTFGWLLCLK